MTAPAAPQVTSVLGFDVAVMAPEDAARWVLARSLSEEPATLVVTLNPEIIIQSRSDSRLAAALQSAGLTVADGVGVVWAARRAGTQLPGRVPGVDLTARVLELGGADLPVFFLGSRPGVAARAAAVAADRWGVTVAGHRHGYFDRDSDAAEVTAEVAASGARLVLAGLGEGQELFLQQHLDAMGVRVAIGVGGTLDVLAGEVQRTPDWTRRLGIEWLWRVGSDRSRWHRFPRLLKFAQLVLRTYR